MGGTESERTIFVILISMAHIALTIRAANTNVCTSPNHIRKGIKTMSVIVLKIPNSSSGSRILSKKEAAAYCRIPVNKFSSICPVTPLDMGNGGISYDLRDLDDWIDSLKAHNPASNDDEIVKLLGS